MGWSAQCQLITGKLNADNSPTAMQIRKMPDFVILSPPPESKLFYVEVKYRKSCDFPASSDKIELYPYKDVRFVIVSKKDIRCISYKEIMDGKRILSNDSFLLENSVEFKLQKKLVRQFQQYSEKFFNGVD